MLKGLINTRKKKNRYFNDWKTVESFIQNWFTAYLKSNSYLNEKFFQLTGRWLYSSVLLKLNTPDGTLKLCVPYDQINEGPNFAYNGSRYIDKMKAIDPNFDLAAGLVVDIGAHVGSFSVPLAFHYKNIRVLVAEPGLTNIKILQRNVTLNGIGNRFQIFSGAIYDKTGEIEFGAGKRSTIGSVTETASYKLYQNKKSSFGSGKTSSIACTTLEALLQNEKDDKYVLLKMDCEGSEYKILKHSKELIAKFHYLVIEAHPSKDGTPAELKKAIQDLGYELIEDDLENGCFEFFCKKNPNLHF